MNLSDFLTSINTSKEPLLDKDPTGEKEYLPFVVNKCLSYFPDTIFYANQMNILSDLGKKLQYDYLRLSVTKRKRFSRWFKEDKDDDIQTIKEYYGYSSSKAKGVLLCLKEQDLIEMRKSLEKGGSKTKKL